MLEHINPPQLPDMPALGIRLSHAVRWQDLVFVSGQVPTDASSPRFPDVVSDDFREQAVQTFRNLETAVVAAGSAMDRILKLTVYLADLADFDVMNEVMAQSVPAPYPARMTLQAVLRGFQIEVEAVAVACT